MEKPTKKRVGRPRGRITPHRPVLSARVSQELYDEITKAAKASRRTISEELVWQAQIALEIGDAQKTLSDISHATEATLYAKMREAGWKVTHGAQGDYWAKEGAPPLQVRLDPSMQAAITEAVREALKSAKGDKR